MKNLFLIAAALLSLTFAPKVEAGYSIGSPALIAGGTNNVAHNATNTYTKPITAIRGDYVGLHFQWFGGATATNNVTFVIERGLKNDTNYWTSVASRKERITFTSTNGWNQFSTNMYFGAIGWGRLVAVENGCTNTTGGITNLTVEYSIKN